MPPADFRAVPSTRVRGKVLAQTVQWLTVCRTLCALGEPSADVHSVFEVKPHRASHNPCRAGPRRRPVAGGSAARECVYLLKQKFRFLDKMRPGGSGGPFPYVLGPVRRARALRVNVRCSLDSPCPAPIDSSSTLA